MAGFDIKQLAAGEFGIHGELTRHTVARGASAKAGALFTAPVNRISLQAVSRVDSAGLAWLLWLVERATNQNIQLSFCQLPVELVKLATLSAVDGILPISD